MVEKKKLATKAKNSAAVKTKRKPVRDAKKFLSDVPQEYVFWCCDGRILKNLKELGDALSVMGNEIFSYHANEHKNDFSAWVREVIGDKTLSKKLQNADSCALAAWQVTTRVEQLSKQLP